MDADDGPLEEPNPPTEIDYDDDDSLPVSAGKRTARSCSPPNSRYVIQLSLPCNSDTNFARALKRSKAFYDLEDTRPTLRNKPSGLKSDWHRVATKSSTFHPMAPSVHRRTSSSSTLASLARPRSPSDFDHMSSTVAMSPPPSMHNSSSPAFQGDMVFLIDEEAAEDFGRPKKVSNLSLCFVRRAV